MVIETNSTQETIELGARLGARLKAEDVVCLIGDLGSGKTQLTKGIAKGLKIKSHRYVNSPTFMILNIHHGETSTLYHLDFYRLNNKQDALDAGLDEYIPSDGVTVIEWADRIADILPDHRLDVYLEILSEHHRRITISKVGRFDIDLDTLEVL